YSKCIIWPFSKPLLFVCMLFSHVDLSSSSVKDGVCPRLSLVQNVSGDSNCPGSLKCCYSGCGRVCVQPRNIVKHGDCPSLVWYGKAQCSHARHQCSHDYDCGGHHKCCYHGCSRVCVAPNRGRGETEMKCFRNSSLL
uniref:WAP domain-containing protein n=1 Tax=Salarias fasciatus TaxID=181472 RepID=A0A672ITR0_SALFA